MNEQVYLDNQLKHYRSFESQSPHWAEGQRRFIEEYLMQHTSPTAHILDCACGDGVGLAVFRRLGFTNVEGVELEGEKFRRACAHDYLVYQADMHDLHLIPFEAPFDLVYSSHSLEHAHNPAKVVGNFNAILKPGGKLVLVLPYPDTGPLDAHCAKELLGTSHDDGGMKITAFVENHGFRIYSMKYDSFREPEIWLQFIKR